MLKCVGKSDWVDCLFNLYLMFIYISKLALLHVFISKIILLKYNNNNL